MSERTIHERRFMVEKSSSPIHLFDEYHDYTICRKSVYSESVERVKEHPTDYKAEEFCRKCVKVYDKEKRGKYWIKNRKRRQQLFELRLALQHASELVDRPDMSKHRPHAFNVDAMAEQIVAEVYGLT